MSEEDVRQLKAIMFTDIKGFSSMMGVDEERTVRLVREHRELVRETLAKHRGTERQTIGDAFMVLFDSAVNAVKCAVEIQNRLHEKNNALPETERVWLRIGIHLGDIIIDEKEIYGDGVNIAARVEPQAEPGGICITQQVFHQIEGKLDCRVIHIGQRELKNIRNAPDLYSIILDHAGEASASPSLASGRAQVVDKDAVWPKQPWWKHVIWWLVAAPIPALLIILPMGDLRTGTGFIGGSSALAVALNLLIPAALLIAAFFASRFWSRGRFNRWLQGRYFIAFPAAGLLLFLYHYVVLQGRIESAILPVRSYAVLSSALMAGIARDLSGAIAAYLNSWMLDNCIVAYLALVVLLGFVFHPRGAGTPVFRKRHWLVLGVGLVLMIIAEFVFMEQLMMGGLMHYVMYLGWFITAMAILRSARAEGEPSSGGARSLGFGLILIGLFSSISSAAGLIMVVGALGKFSQDWKPVLWRTGMNEINTGHFWARGILLVLLAVLVLVLRKGIGWSRKEPRSSMAFDLASMGLAFVLAMLPLLMFPQATGAMYKALSLPIGGLMHPAVLKPDAEPSFYVDKRPAAIGLYGHRMHMEITGEEHWRDYEEAMLFGALAGGKECKALIEASIGDPTEKTVGPGLCLTAVEAKIACEVQGKRLASPGEWDAAVGGLKPVDPAAKADPAAPITRLPIGEWTMRMVHGNPIFELKGADASAEIPKTLSPTAFSPKVGFRCAYVYER